VREQRQLNRGKQARVTALDERVLDGRLGAQQRTRHRQHPVERRCRPRVRSRREGGVVDRRGGGRAEVPARQ
jgi:hypothetical protein